MRPARDRFAALPEDTKQRRCLRFHLSDLRPLGVGTGRLARDGRRRARRTGRVAALVLPAATRPE